MNIIFQEILNRSIKILLLFAVAVGVMTAEVQAEPVLTANTQVELVSALQGVAPGGKLPVAIRFQMAPEWHIYWKNPGDSGIPPSIKWKLPENFSAGDIDWPYPQKLPLPPLMSYGYMGEAYLYSDIQVPQGLPIGSSVHLEADLIFLACEVQCVPGQAHLVLDLPVEDAPAPDIRWEEAFAKRAAVVPGMLSTWKPDIWDDGHQLTLKLKGHNHAEAPQEATLEPDYFFPERSDLIQHAAPQVIVKKGDTFVITIPRSTLHQEPVSELKGVLIFKDAEGTRSAVIDAGVNVAGNNEILGAGVAGALIFAFLGGLILNLMPCVLPVLALKVLGLISKGGHRRADSIREGVLFAAGVIACFWVLALMLVVLKWTGHQVGWGFQFQSPIFVAALAVLFFLLALNLWGVFEISVPLGFLSQLGGAQNTSNSFWNGVLATLVATPCTAPFMGSALGFALTQPLWVTLAVFTLLGLGMACPYLILSAFPELLKFVPKPGAWMIVLKRILSIPLFLTVVWLVWVLLVSRGVAGGDLRRSDKIVWNTFSAEAVKSALSEGHPVFVDFTATWCLTCQANERLTLDQPSVVARLKELGVVTLKADWTSYDERITKALEGFGKNSIPLYVLYLPRQERPEILPEIITPAIVLDRLNKISSAAP